MLLKNQITMEDLLLGNSVIFENEETENEEISKENNESYNEEVLKDKDVYVEDIHISTLSLINEFLEEIKLSSKNYGLNRRIAIEGVIKRQETYESLFDQYYGKVLDSDKEIFSKLINYITAEASDSTTYSDPCSNMQMYLEYEFKYKGANYKEVYRNEGYFTTEGNLISRLGNELHNRFGETGKSVPSEYYRFLDGLQITIYSSYDVKFNMNDIKALEKQVQDIINSKHFKNWKFAGKRNEYQQRILRYLFGAKHEVMSHKGRGELVHKNINVNTCRYIACLVSYVKISKYRLSSDRILTIEDKTNLYNELYPYFLEEIQEDNREFFAKAANYLSFENNEYSITGYNHFSNTSKESAYKRLDLLNKITEACVDGKITKSKKPKNIDVFSNYSTFTFAFMHGAGVSSNKEWVDKRIRTLTNILENDAFKNWKFSGLKTKAEDSVELEYVDIFKEINFSEDSYYILGIVLNTISLGKTLEERKNKKEKILKLIDSHIPNPDKKTFDILLNHYTDEDEFGFNTYDHLIRIEVKIKRKADGVRIGSFWLKNTNKYSDITKKKVIESIDSYYGIVDIVTEDNLYDIVELEYTAKALYMPTTITSSDEYSDKNYIKQWFGLIIKESEAKASKAVDDAQEQVESISEVLVTNDNKIESNSNIETMFDILDMIQEKEIPKNDKKNVEGQFAFLI